MFWLAALSLLVQDSVRITSSFAEYRHLHFHGGLDYSTFGKTGVPVLAPVSGTVFRIQFSPWGYGNNLWLLGDDGRVYRFVHLERFCRQLDSVAYFWREKTQALVGTLQVSLRVRAGDTVAFSGESGAGPPHLHFEVYERGRLVNPVKLGFNGPDTLPPVIRGISAVPLGGSVEGLPWEVFYPPGDTVRASGPVGFLVWAHDRWGACTGLASVEVLWDDSVIFELEFREIDPQWTRFAELTYAYQGGRNCKTPLRTFKLRPRQPGAGEGRVLVRGTHALTVVVRDFAGHEAKARWTVVESNEKRPTRPVFWDYEGDSLRFRAFGYGLLVFYRGRLNLSPVLETDSGAYYWVSGDAQFEAGGFKFSARWVSGPCTLRVGSLLVRFGEIAVPFQAVLVQGQFTTGLFPRYPPLTEKAEISSPPGTLPFLVSFGGKPLRLARKRARFGWLAALRDTAKPWAKFTRLSPRLVSAGLGDELSGVALVRLWAGGRYLPFQWDPEKKRLWARPWRPLRPGTRVRLEVVDAAGNERVIEGVVK